MKGLSKEHINCTFGELLFSLSDKSGIPQKQLTVDICFADEKLFYFKLCQNGVSVHPIPFFEMLTIKMVALRFSTENFKKLFRTIHRAFIMETKVANPRRISLVLYYSDKVKCPCVGVRQDEKTLKVMKLSDIVHAIELESEQLN